MSTTQVCLTLRAHALSLPDVKERLSHGAPTFFVRDKRSFLTMWRDGHHEANFAQLWCAAEQVERDYRVFRQPEVFFIPPYVGHLGWVGVRLDVSTNYDELVDLVEDAYRLRAPATLVALLDQRDGRR